MTRTLVILVAGLSLLCFSVEPGYAQQADSVAADTSAVESRRGQGSGTVALTNWPTSLGQLLDEMGRRAPYLLPKIDSLALDYRYAANDSTSQWSFVLGWQPGARVLYKGDVLSRRSGPANVRMVNVELRAQVHADGRHVGDMIVAVDSMTLAPLPGIYSFEVTVGHSRVFLEGSAATARQALLEGATLDSLVVERMGFVTDRPSSSQRRRPDVQERRPVPGPEPSIYEPRTRIFIGWRVAPRPYYVAERNGKRTVQRREATIGRGSTDEGRQDRTATRRGATAAEEGGRKSGRSKEEKEDEEDDDTSLRGPALGAAMAVGLVAMVGGTVGLYGRGDTPLGLAAGYTHPRGGVQLQAAINGAVIRDDSGQKLTMKAFGFYDVFASRVQPALGLGLQVDPSTDGSVSPAISLGLAANFESVVLFGGVDVVEGTPELGVAYNFRYRSGRN